MAEKILIVDDDVETLRLVGLMLQRQGYEIIAADNGAQAIVLAKSESPDLIVLDVMMPEMDGYQVTHMLRKMPETALAPILMFTAKSQVDDKVAGYDAGVDDYLTKPVHPAELVAHIKALLSRTRTRPVIQEEPAQKSFMIGVLACRGGLGTSTLALNLATSFARINKGSSVIAVELRPGQGTWGYELGFNNPDGLSTLLQLKPTEIDTTTITNSLITTAFGVKILLAPILTAELNFSTLADHLIAILKVLSKMNTVIFVDIGTSFLPGFDKICNYLNSIILLTEPQLVTVKRTKTMVEELNAANLTAGKTIDLVLYNRIRADIQMNSIQVSEEMKGMPVSIMIPPSPELANQATQSHKPMINVQPDGLVAQQFNRMAEILQERILQNQ